MTRYRSKPIEIEAILWTGANTRAVKDFIAERIRPEDSDDGAWFVTRNEGGSTQAWRYIADGQNWGPEIRAAVFDKLHNTWVGVKKHQWIIFGTDGEFYPCDNTVFQKKYEES